MRTSEDPGGLQQQLAQLRTCMAELRELMGQAAVARSELLIVALELAQEVAISRDAREARAANATGAVAKSPYRVEKLTAGRRAADDYLS